MEVTAAHEYNHVLQYAYDIAQDPWMYESTATSAEEKVFPADDDYHGYMGTWADNPAQPITSASGLKMYGSAIWNHWLEQRYGADVVRRAWEKSVTSGGFAPDAYDLAIDDEAGGTSFGGELRRPRGRRGRVGRRDSGIFEGVLFPHDVMRGASCGRRNEHTTTLDHTGYELFNVFPRPGAGSAPLQLTASLRKAAGNGATGTIALIGIDDGDVTKVVARTDESGAVAVVTLDDPGRFDRITAMVANADIRNTGFNALADDWLWSRDAEAVELSLATVPARPPTCRSRRPARPTSPARAWRDLRDDHGRGRPGRRADPPTPSARRRSRPSRRP